MKASELNLVFIDEYLNAEGRDKEKLKHYLQSAKNYVMKINGFESEEELDENEFLTDYILMYIEQMYDKGYVEENKYIKGMLTLDRRY